MKKKNQNNFMQGVINLMASQVVIKILGIFYKIYLTNKEGYGDKGNAIYTSAYQIYTLILSITSIAIPNSMSKLVAEKIAVGNDKGAYKILKVALGVFGIFSFLISLMIFINSEKIAKNYLQISEAQLVIEILTPSVFLVAIGSVLKGYFNGKGSINITANSQTFEQIFRVIITIITIEIIGKQTNNNTILMAVGTGFATTISEILSLWYLYCKFQKNKKSIWKEVLKSTYNKAERIKDIITKILVIFIPLSVSNFFSVINKSIDALTIIRILKKSLGYEMATEQYGILSGKIDSLISLPYSFNISFSIALVPAIAAAIAKESRETVEKRIKFSILITILIGLLCTAYMTIFSNEIIEILFPRATSGGEILKIASFSIVFVVLVQTISGALQGIGETKALAKTFAVSAVLKLIFNIILLPIIGIKGAIISSLISHIISFVICYIKLKNSVKINLEISKFIIKPIVACLMASTISYLLNLKLKEIINENISLILALLIGTISYILSIFAMRNFSEEEISMIPYGKKIHDCIKYKRLKSH